MGFMIRIGRKKSVNKFKTSFCAKSLVPETYGAKVGNFLKKSLRLGDWVRGTLVFQVLEKYIAVRIDKVKNTYFFKKNPKMSSSSSFSSVRSSSSANKYYEIEEELLESEKSDLDVQHEDGHVDDDSDIEAYFDEPIADEVWQAEYNRRREEDNERMRELQLRWNGDKPLVSW